MPVYSKPKTAAQATPYPSQAFMPQPVNPGAGAFGYPPYNPGMNAVSNTPYPTSFPSMPTPFMPMGGGPSAGYNPNYVSDFLFVSTEELNESSSFQNQSQGTITEEHIKASLISAVEDKLRRRLQERVNQIQAEIQTLNRTKQELTEGQSKIKDIIMKLEAEHAELTRNMETLREKDAELDKCLETIEKAGEMDIDEAVVTTAPLYRQ